MTVLFKTKKMQHAQECTHSLRNCIMVCIHNDCGERIEINILCCCPDALREADDKGMLREVQKKIKENHICPKGLKNIPQEQ